MKLNCVVAGLAVVTLAGLSVGCASGRSLSAADDTYGAASAELAVTGFLAAAQARRYTDMAHLFGTPDGPAEKKFGVDEVEKRMVVLASLMQHRAYTLDEPDLRVLGPDHRWYVANMVGTRKGPAEVIIVAARTDQDRWFVEQVDLSSLTRDQP
jgi:hypothetical protein